MIDWNTVLTSTLIATIVSALVGAFGHWITRGNTKLAAKISSENAKLAARLEAAKKLTDSRQNWIDQLRQDMSEFLALASLKSRKSTVGEGLSDEQFFRLVSLMTRIEMRMNPKDKEYSNLHAGMMSCVANKEAAELGGSSAQLVDTCQKILKKEWEVLKAKIEDLDITLER